MYGRVFKNADCTEIYPEMFKCDVFEINYLNIAPPERRKGYGNKFIKFAQAESRKITVKAEYLPVQAQYMIMNTPVIFLQKTGIYISKIKY